MGRAPCCEKDEVRKGAWTPQEDKLLVDYISKHGHATWRSIPKLAGLKRCGKSCRLRWANYLRPDIKRGPFTHQEQNTIIQLHGLIGNKWAAIAAQLQGRTDNEVKNYWNSHLKKRFELANRNTRSIDLKSETPSTSHMAQWESARVEAEARLSSMASSHKPCLLETNRDHFLRLWNSDVGQSFRKVPTHVVGPTGTIDTPNEENTIIRCEQMVAEEEMVISSDYLDDGSDLALKLWLDFLSGNDMGFLEGHTDDGVSIFLPG